MEIWDILDTAGNLTGRTIQRGKPLSTGDYHLVVHILIQDEQGRYLIQKRADHLEWKPGIWAFTGGSAIRGEDSISAAIRECEEELGLRYGPERMTKLHRLKRESDFADLWLVKDSAKCIESVKLNPEVTAVKWTAMSEIKTMIKSGQFHDYRDRYFRILENPNA